MQNISTFVLISELRYYGNTENNALSLSKSPMSYTL